VLERGQQGLGLELDSTNTIVHIKPGGRAEQQGLVRVEDVILSVDGRSCAGKLMQEVMVPGRSVYVIEISRTEYMTGRAKQREAKQLAIASAGSMSAYAIPVALLAFVLAYLYWPLRLVALVIAYMYWRNSR
jgi:C-terminal processing protease CtpA/Prc